MCLRAGAVCFGRAARQPGGRAAVPVLRLMACHEGSHLLLSVMRWAGGSRRQGLAVGTHTNTTVCGVTPKVPTSWSCESCSRRRLSSLSLDAMMHSSWIILSWGESRPAMAGCFGCVGGLERFSGCRTRCQERVEAFMPFPLAQIVKLLRKAKPQAKNPMGCREGKALSANCCRHTFESCTVRHSDWKRISVPDHPDHCCVGLRQHRGTSCSVCRCL